MWRAPTTLLTLLMLILGVLAGCPGQLSRGSAALTSDGGRVSPDHADLAVLGDLRPLPCPGCSADGAAAPPTEIWRPGPGTTWVWQLTGKVDTTVDVQMYDVDLFDASPTMIAQLQAAGRAVVCYFSAGSFEEWRPDAGDFPEAALGEDLDGWEGERWLDIRAAATRAVVARRLDLARDKGCDGVEPDNVDGYRNESGFDLSAKDQLDFNTFLADEAHRRHLSIGLKNDIEQIAALEPLFDWALNEQCLKFKECQRHAPFIDGGKAVFHVEYTAGDAQETCQRASDFTFSTLVKRKKLDSWFHACW